MVKKDVTVGSGENGKKKNKEPPQARATLQDVCCTGEQSRTTVAKEGRAAGEVPRGSAGRCGGGSSANGNGSPRGGFGTRCPEEDVKQDRVQGSGTEWDRRRDISRHCDRGRRGRRRRRAVWPFVPGCSRSSSCHRSDRRERQLRSEGRKELRESAEERRGSDGRREWRPRELLRTSRTRGGSRSGPP